MHPLGKEGDQHTEGNIRTESNTDSYTFAKLKISSELWLLEEGNQILKLHICGVGILCTRAVTKLAV